MRLRNNATKVALVVALSVAGTSCTNDDPTSGDAGTDEAPSATAESSDGSVDAGGDASQQPPDDATSAPDELAAAGNDNVPEPSNLAGVEQLWIDNGTSPELASCYRGVLETAGVDEVADLNELTEILSGLDPDQKNAMDECVNS